MNKKTDHQVASNKKKTKLSYLMADDQDESMIEKKSIGDLKAFLSILRFAKPYRRGIFTALFLILSSTFAAMYSAKNMGALVQDGLIAKDYDQSIFLAGLIVLMELVALLTLWLGRRILSQNSSKTIFDIRASLFEHLQHLPLNYFDRQPQGRIVVRITHDVEGIEDFFSNSLGRLLNSLFLAIMSMVWMVATDMKIGLILVATMIPALIFIFVTKETVRKLNRKLSMLNSAINSKLSEFINGLEVIRVFGLEKWSKKEYDGAVNEHLDALLDANKFFGWTRPFVSLFCSLPVIGLVWFGGLDVISGALSVGLFVTFVRYLDRFTQPIMTLAREIHVVQTAFTSAERVATFLSEETEKAVLGEDGKIDNVGHLHGELKFDNVSMAYQDEDWVLNNIKFHLLPGEKIGLVGKTGCGKTTTVSLLSRLYEFQKGEIYLDGRPLRSYARNYLRDQIGFVSQDAIIFRASLRDNLTTNTSFTDSYIMKACQETGLSNVMADSNLSLSSLILEGGANLSVGERQLVSLTRVLLKDPAILILDEATANIDPKFEKIIHTAVDRIMVGRTCLIIAHRLSTLDHCDRILVFDNGELIEDGTKEDLTLAKGHFYQLHNAGLKN